MEKFSRVILLFIIVLCLGCSNTITDAGTKSATLVPPKLVVKVYTDPDSNPEVSLPLLIWDSFEYRKINLKPGWSQGGGKETFCVINESEGTNIELGTSIEFIEDATCFYTYFTSSDGLPHKYTIGLVKIKIIDTGEEVWTWSKAVSIEQ